MSGLYCVNEAGDYEPALLGHLAGHRQCRRCGCTDNDACVLPGIAVPLGGTATDRDQLTCSWALPDLCSRCAVGFVIVQPWAGWTDVGTFVEGFRQWAAGRA